MTTTTFKLGTTFLIIFLFSIITQSSLLAQNLPQNHSRWIGELEGLVVDEQASALVYEFNFSDDGNVDVSKHMTTKKLEQTFSWKTENNNIIISGDANGAIGELADHTLSYVNDTEFSFKYLDGKTDIRLQQSKQLLSWLHIVFLFCLLFFGNELARRYKIAPYIMFILIPIILTPVWLDSGMGWFRIIKVYSALTGAIFFTVYRFNFGLNKMTWPKYVIAFILGFNILEAVTQDWSQPHLANNLNAFAGVLTLITIYLWTTIRVNEKKPNDMVWPGMTVGWIIIYDLWNLSFVYLNFPNTVAYSLTAVILAPTIAALFVTKGTWLQARAYSLSIYMMYICSHYVFDLDITLTEPLPRNEYIIWTLVTVTVAANVIYAILHFRYRFTGKAPKFLEVGQSQSVID